MKTLGALLLLGFTCLLPLRGLAADASADADYAAFQALVKINPPGSPNELGAEKFLTWTDTHRQELGAAALSFYGAHLEDPRRWEVVAVALKAPPYFIKGFGLDVATKGMAAIIADDAAVADWRQQVDRLSQALLTAPDAPLALREDVAWGLFAKDFRATSAAKKKGEAYDYGPFRGRFDAHVAAYGTLDVVAGRAADYLGALEANLPGASTEIWKHLQDSSNAALRTKAAERLQFLDATSRPLEIAFTSADGRPVDLKNLRGKVVLVDFWATWCGPCIAELPNVKQVYAAYHDRGFEVVGIALENGRLAPGDTPEQIAKKMDAARKILTDFTAKNEMPWPQYFDGKYWKNDISTKYAINAIPAMFLLDQEGRIVSTNARGELLEREVKRLLKL